MRRFVAVLVSLALAALPLYAVTGTHAPNVAVQYFNNSGEPCNGCLLFTYSPGTTTKKATYTDVALSSANTNPIVLDSAGRATIFLTPGESYKFVLAPSTDTDPPASPTWTRDNVSAIAPAGSATDNDVSGTAGETLAAGDAVYLSDGSGSKTAGRWYQADADNTYSSTAAAQVGAATAAAASGAAVTVRLAGRVTGLSGLVAGTIYYLSGTAGAFTSTAPTNARAVGQADSTTTLVLGPWATLAASTVNIEGAVDVTGATTVGGALTVTGEATVQGFRPVVVLTADSATYKQGTPASGGATGWSYSLPAGTLATDGDALRITVLCDTVGSANTTTEINLKFGATSHAWRLANDANKVDGQVVFLVQRTGAATQRVSAWGVRYTGVTQNNAFSSPTETLSGAITISTTHGAGSSGTDYVQQVGIVVEYLPI